MLDQPLKAGNYRLVEIKAPEGFIKTEDIDFTITNSVVSETDPDGDPIQIISVSDEQAKGKVTLTKTDKETGEAMADVEYQLTAKEDILDPVDGSVLYETGEVVSQGKTDTDGKMVLDDLPLGHYELKETLTQEGYVLSEQVHDVHLKQKDDTTKEYVVDLNITNIKPVGRIHVLKTDQDTEQPLGGITFQLTAKEDIYSLDGRNTLLYEAGQPVSVDISENGQYVTNELGEVFIGDLPLGKYELKEIQTLDGYYSNAEVYEIDLSYDGSDKTVYLEELNITNEKTKVDISKVDATTGKEIEGAHMSLTDKETGEVIEEWVSAKEPHRIEGLSVGKTYILHEDIAPAGYELAQDVEFTIEDTGEVQKVVMEDELTPVTPDTPHTGSKTDLKMYAALAGLSGIVITLIYMGRKKKSKK